jgi:hypothetical protein
MWPSHPADEEAELIRVRLHLAETALDYVESQVDLDTCRR